METQKIFHSKTFVGIVIGMVSLIFILLIFWAGIFVGRHQANFLYRWGDNYHRNMGGPRGGYMGMMSNFPNPNGVSGKIISINLPTITTESSEGVEKNVLIKNDTVIREFMADISAKDLKVNDEVVVIGDPSSTGEIEARFIRVAPGATSSSTPQS